MTADRTKLRFYVDESALGLGKTLEAARNDTIHCGHHPGSGMPTWIARHSMDSVRRRSGLGRIGARQEGAHFRIDTRNDLSTWEWLVLLVHHWPAMEEIIC